MLSKGGIMSKVTLIIVGILVVFMGIWSLVPAWQIAGVADPMWHAWAKIVVGLVAVVIAVTDSNK